MFVHSNWEYLSYAKKYAWKCRMKNYWLAELPLCLQRHVMHVVPLSPWPLVTAVSVMLFLLTIINLFRYSAVSTTLVVFSTACLLASLLFWGSDVITEGAFLRMHTVLMQRAFYFAIILFIVSEIMFFFTFFWSFFHYSLSPSVFIYNMWPPYGISTINPWEIPLLNTVILLSSGVSLTVAHRAFLVAKIRKTAAYLYLTVCLGIIFTGCQLYEYTNCSFSINDSVYGSIFFLTTGFHGFHVLVGTGFLLLTLFRLYSRTFNVVPCVTLTMKRPVYNVGFDLATWYWHFVDVIWLFLFVAIYWWGG